LNIAHRGASAEAPENTLVAFEKAIERGASVVEFDVRQTADGHLVLLHDESVDRTTNGSGLISEMTLAEAQALDGGYSFTMGDQTPFRGQGVVIPTLEEALESFPDLYWDVEIKQLDPPIYNEVVSTIEAVGKKNRAFLACFDDSTVMDIRAAHPDWVTNFGNIEAAIFYALSEETEDDYTPPGDILQVKSYFIDDAFVARARRFGLKIHVWTVNDEVEMEQLIDAGVDGLITDDPGLLSAVLQH
jgi:glycerophosphoryl diester phosphodiesterase